MLLVIQRFCLPMTPGSASHCALFVMIGWVVSATSSVPASAADALRREPVRPAVSSDHRGMGSQLATARSDLSALPSAPVEAAIEALRRNDLEEARRQLESVTTQDCSHVELLLAQLLLASGRRDWAKSIIEDYSTRPGDACQAHLAFAELAASEGRWFDADVHVRFCETAPAPTDWSTARQTQVLLTLTMIKGQTAEARNDPAAAQKIYRAALQHHPDAKSLVAALARTSVQLGQHDAALKHFSELAQSDPAAVPPELQVARLAWANNQLEAAEAYFGRALQHREQPARSVAILAYVRWLLDRDLPTQAQRWLSREPLAPEFSDAVQLLRAAIARRQQEYDTSRQLLEDLLGRDPDSFQVANQLALVLIESGDESDRSRALQMAEANARDHGDIPRAWSTLGWIQFRQGDLAAAERNLSYAIQQGVLSRETTWHLSEVKKRLRDQQSATPDPARHRQVSGSPSTAPD